MGIRGRPPPHGRNLTNGDRGQTGAAVATYDMTRRGRLAPNSSPPTCKRRRCVLASRVTRFRCKGTRRLSSCRPTAPKTVVGKHTRPPRDAGEHGPWLRSGARRALKHQHSSILRPFCLSSSGAGGRVQRGATSDNENSPFILSYPTPSYPLIISHLSHHILSRWAARRQHADPPLDLTHNEPTNNYPPTTHPPPPPPAIRPTSDLTSAPAASSARPSTPRASGAGAAPTRTPPGSSAPTRRGFSLKGMSPSSHL